ncbi:unnamed protein product [Kuraishia capsulata CBS 1993]|uniref:Uncharacterized protein n=1 Tax=Kuraishia capsulata CBS 1993 TaxID=1382522 RepID=W6MSM6_9ASCO|nr:uncharacterized protein KUCA_T00000756001 [Kuraishia capsulata CBS 1993]CDK24790.1 unnamed protein product [Kuraishia capsulata CBS 1993]
MIRQVRRYRTLSLDSCAQSYYRRMESQRNTKSETLARGVRDEVSPNPRMDWMFDKNQRNDSYHHRVVSPKVEAYRHEILGQAYTKRLDQLTDEMILSCIYSDASYDLSVNGSKVNTLLVQLLGESALGVFYEKPNLSEMVEGLYKQRHIKTSSSMKSLRQLVGFISLTHGFGESEKFFLDQILTRSLIGSSRNNM